MTFTNIVSENVAHGLSQTYRPYEQGRICQNRIKPLSAQKPTAPISSEQQIDYFKHILKGYIMNKVFRVIWSQATQSWVAVSELTKAHKKQSSSTAKKSASGSSANLIKSSAIALALLSGHSAYATLNEAGTGNDNSVALGGNSNASGGASVALGNGSKATGGDAYAIGWGSNASGSTSISIGNRSTASGNNSVALGSGANAVTSLDIALGNNANTIRGDRNIAIGDGATAGTNRSGGAS